MLADRIIKTTSTVRMIGIGVLVGWAIGAGALAIPTSQAHPEIRKGTQTEGFKSGAERSEAVLKDILDTLNRLDGRLERIENALLKAVDQQD